MFRDREYVSTLIRIALPIAFQNLMSALLNMIGVIMIGQLGETAVAGVGLANQVFFLLILMMFGITSGTAIFTAQLWGQKDIPGIRRVLGLGLGVSMTGGLVFTILAVFFSRNVLHIYSNDPAVIEIGSEYLRIIGFSYLITAVTQTYSSVLRSTGQVRVPTVVGIASIVMDATLNYILIFGKLGLPAMGVRGAAVGTCLARYFEATLLLSITYGGKYPAAARLRELFGASRELVKKYLVTALPVALGETLWSLGYTTYNIIYAHISTEAVAAVNISATVENLAFVLFFGLTNASAIMIGNQIGAGKEDRAFLYARRAMILSLGGGLLMGAVVILSSDGVLALYKVSDTVRIFAHNILYVLGGVLWIRVSNMIVIAAILRSGGDTRFALVLDTSSIWLIGVPLGYISAFVLHLPIYFVVLIVMTEEVIKLVIGLLRVRSKRWINNLVQAAG